MTIKFQFEEFKAALKDKWLDYYEVNRHWLSEAMRLNGYWYEDLPRGKRPEARFILGVITVIEPQLQQFLATLIELNSDPDSLVKALGLDFDPKSEVEKRAEERAKERAKIQAIDTIPLLAASDAEYLNKIRQESIT